MSIQSIRIITNRRNGIANADITDFNTAWAKKVRKYHDSFPEYAETPLCELRSLSEYLDLGSVFVKDESKRFGLNAFKVLGGSYCLGRLLAEIAGIPEREMTYSRLIQPDVKDIAEKLTVVTATDGNHGRGIAWSAKQFGMHAVVYMPQGSAQERLENIRKLGAEAEITDCNYDATVLLAEKTAKENGWMLVQDTAWPGYERIPSLIMQGYTTMAKECVEQLGEEIPTHIFLQAGVGAMAGALTAFFTDYYHEKKPRIAIVEPDGADCLFRTAEAADGKLHPVSNLNTIMAGLCCGLPCTLGWNILSEHADYFVSVPDLIAAKGMRILSSPLSEDPRIISGESGAVTVGVIAEIAKNPAYSDIREILGLDANSKVLCISTEGDTDPENYRRIVWDGAYHS